MKVRIKLYAVAKELAGRTELVLDVGDSARIADIRRAVEQSHPELRSLLRHALWAVDAEYASDEQVVAAHSDIALIPPVSGG
jgi:molybdopterin converting factor small subunit